METDVLIHNILTLLHFTSIFQRIINYFNVCMHASKSLPLCPTLCNPMDYIAHQAPLSIESSRQEYWSGLPFPSPADLLNPGDWTWVSCVEGGFFTDWATREAYIYIVQSIFVCVCMCVCVYTHSALALRCVRLFATPWTVVFQAPLTVGILQSRILEWFAIPVSRVSSRPRDWTRISYVSCISRGILYP